MDFAWDFLLAKADDQYDWFESPDTLAPPQSGAPQPSEEERIMDLLARQQAEREARRQEEFAADQRIAETGPMRSLVDETEVTRRAAEEQEAANAASRARLGLTEADTNPQTSGRKYNPNLVRIRKPYRYS